jgi:hypothetical protein
MFMLAAILLILSNTAFAAHNVVLNWSPSPDGAANPTSGYSVLRGNASGGESATPIITGAGVGCTNTTTCTATDNAVSAGQTLYYEVIFVVGSTKSVPSNEAQATVPIASPTGLTAVAN